MTILLLTVSTFLFILIFLTIVLELAADIPGRKERKDAERRNHYE